MSDPISPFEQEIELMFLGEFERSLDSKGRVTLPVSFRDVLGEESAILTRGFDRCLFLFNRPAFETWRQKIRALPMTDKASRNLRRHIFAGASEVSPDGQGRINLPSWLREYAELDSVVTVAGMDNYVEIWNASRWSETNSEFQESASDAKGWAALGI